MVNSPFIFITISGGLSDSPYNLIKRNTALAPIFRWELVNN